MPSGLIAFREDSTTGTAASTDFFIGPFGGGFGAQTNEVQMPMPFAATLQNLRIFSRGASGGSGSTSFTLRVNGVDSALTCSIAQGLTPPVTGSDLVNTVSVSAGDLLSFKYRHSATGSGILEPCVTIEAVPASGARGVLLFASTGGSPSTSTRFLEDYLGGLVNSTLEVFALVPAAGTLRNLRVRARTAPVGVGSIGYTVRVNGVASALACSVSQGAAPHAGSDTVNSVAVVGGDKVSVAILQTVLPGTNGADFVVTMEIE